MIFTFGRLRVLISGTDSLVDYCRKSWQKYLLNTDESDTDLILCFEKKPELSEISCNDGWNQILIGGELLNVYTRGTKPLFALQHLQCQKKVKIYLASEKSNVTRLGAQFGLLTALYQEFVGIHGVTVLCGNEIVILSAPSGTGKTTMAKLLEKHCDAIIINGDFALLCPTEQGVIFEPTPFCGTSGRNLNHRLRVNRIVFLDQARENIWRELGGQESLKRFMSNCFIPTWGDVLSQTIQETILKCIPMLKVNAYSFFPAEEAASTFINQLDTKM